MFLFVRGLKVPMHNLRCWKGKKYIYLRFAILTPLALLFKSLKSLSRSFNIQVELKEKMIVKNMNKLRLNF